MSVFVVLALALLAAAAGMVVVAGLVLRRQIHGLLHAVHDANSRVAELATELQEETAVATLEIEAISERIGRGRRAAGSGHGPA